MDFRTDFIGERGGFDFLAEFGIGVLDNATVRSAGTVVRSDSIGTEFGTFIRLYDVGHSEKENQFLQTISEGETGIKRRFDIRIDDFKSVPRSPLCYSTPESVRNLHRSDVKIDADRADIHGDSIGDALLGIVTGNNRRFIRNHWETDSERFKPLANGGAEAWIIPQVTESIGWGDSGKQLKRSPGVTRAMNEERYGEKGLVWTSIKETGRRFGYYPRDSLWGYNGPLLASRGSISLWRLLAVLNSAVLNSVL